MSPSAYPRSGLLRALPGVKLQGISLILKLLHTKELEKQITGGLQGQLPAPHVS